MPLNRFCRAVLLCMYNNAIRPRRAACSRASASCNVEFRALLVASARRVSVERLACSPLRALRVRYVQRERESGERETCAAPRYIMYPDPMYYIRNEEWCNKEAAPPKMAEVCRARSRSLSMPSRKSRACFRRYIGARDIYRANLLVSCYEWTAPYAILRELRKKKITPA